MDFEFIEKTIVRLTLEERQVFYRAFQLLNGIWVKMGSYQKLQFYDSSLSISEPEVEIFRDCLEAFTSDISIEIVDG